MVENHVLLSGDSGTFITGEGISSYLQGWYVLLGSFNSLRIGLTEILTHLYIH